PASRRCCARAACASKPGPGTRSTSARRMPTRRAVASGMRLSSLRRVAGAVSNDDPRRREGAAESSAQPGDMAGVIDRNVAALIRRREEARAATSREDRLADAISAFAGSMKFVYFHVAIYGAWIVVNLPWVPLPKFDPSYVVL